MDGPAFDRLVRALSTADTRRRLLAVLTALPLAGLLSGLPYHVVGAKRDHRRGKAHPSPQGDKHQRHHLEPQGKHKKKKKKKKRCVPESRAKTCAGKCATVTNNCRKPVDCGSCACTPNCPQCQTCNAVTGQCQPMADGTACDDGNGCTQADTCQNGSCVSGNPVSCSTPPICHTATGASCNAGTGQCDYPTAPNGTSCGSGQSGNTAICDAGVCHDCTVTCDGGDPSDCGTALQNAIDGASSGDKVYVCPGRYRAPGTSLGFVITGPVTIIGAGEGDNPTTNTILDQDAADCRVLTNQSTAEVSLSGLRITGGTFGNGPGGGGGIYNGEGSNIVVSDCTIIANSSTSDNGGGVANAANATMRLASCTVTDNTAGGGGGIANRGTLTVNHCDVFDNSASGFGGGIASIGGELTIENGTTVRLNDAGGVGAGLYCESVTNVTIDASSITGNTAQDLGGGIRSFATTLTLRNGSDVSGNTGSGGGGFGITGGGAVTIEDSSVTGNIASSSSQGFGGGIEISDATATLTNALVQHNHAGFGGGGISNESGGTVTLAGTTSVTGNTAGTPPVSNNCVGSGDYVGAEHCGP